jgi:hypothetical protein
MSLKKDKKKKKNKANSDKPPRSGLIFITYSLWNSRSKLNQEDQLPINLILDDGIEEKKSI